MNKILSIIIPSYNMERYLPHCLESLILPDAQMRLLDVLVVNDGSKDRTSALAHEFADKYPDAIRVIDKPNGHYGSCINAALPVAYGKYVKVLDADDTFDAANFAEFVAFLMQIGDVDLVTSDYNIVDETGKITEKVVLPFPCEGVFGMKELAEAKHALIMHGAAYRTQMLRDINYHQTEGCVFTDTEWMFRPMLSVKQIVRFPKPVYRYLMGREGQSVDPKEAVKLLPVQVRIFNGILDIYQQEHGKLAPEYILYMETTLRRIYWIIQIVYFDAIEITRLKSEFPPLYRKVKGIAPNSLKFDIGYGTVFGSHAYRVDCFAHWIANPSRSFWVRVWRINLALRGLFK